MLTVTDLFAGAGGSSTGAASVPGVVIARAANHLPLAVDVHAKNFPLTVHACVDLHMEDPRNFPRTDLLWASPECTKWSQANSKAKSLSVAMGGDPTLFDDVPTELQTSEQEEIDRSRLLMFDVLRFVEYHRYRAVIVENVVDVAMQAKYAAAWRLWQKKLRGLGYTYRVVSLNSMHAQMLGDPAPQSRDRLYIVAWPEGEKAPEIDRALRPRAWCQHCELIVESRQAWKPGRSVGRYRAQYIYVCSGCQRPVEPVWLPASTAIDWTLRGERIADRKRPLSDKTMARIREGLRRHAHEFLYPDGHPLRTVTTRDNHGLLVPYYSASRSGRPTTDPLGTLTTVDRYALIMRNYTPRGGAGHMTTPSCEPLRTLTTAGHQSVLEPHTIDPMECEFRMLQPHEIAAGMAFPADYQWEGTGRERVRLAGNAVTPPAARDLVAVVAESLGAAA